MSRLTIAAWAVCVGCIVAALVCLIARPVHWERTVALAVVVGIAAAFTRQVHRRRHPGAARFLASAVIRPCSIRAGSRPGR